MPKGKPLEVIVRDGVRGVLILKGGKSKSFVRLLSEEAIRKELSALEGTDVLPSTTKVNLKLLQKKNPKLYGQLALYGDIYKGFRTPSRGLRYFGYDVPQFLFKRSDENILEEFKKAIPREFALQTLQGENPEKTPAASLLRNHPSDIVRKSYGSLKGRKNYSTDLLKQFVDSLYPELVKEYGSLFDALKGHPEITDAFVSNWLVKNFLRGEHISGNGLSKLRYGGPVEYFIRTRNPQSEQLSNTYTFSPAIPFYEFHPRTLRFIKKQYSKTQTLYPRNEFELEKTHVEFLLQIAKNFDINLTKFSRLKTLIGDEFYFHEIVHKGSTTNGKKKNLLTSRLYSHLMEQPSTLYRVYQEAVNHLLGEIPDFLTKVTTRGSKIAAFMKPKLPYIHERDIVTTSNGTSQVGIISEQQVQLLFQIARRYDPQLDTLTGLRDYISAGLTTILTNTVHENVAVSVDGSVQLADLRLDTEQYSFLVEVKSYAHMTRVLEETTLEKYNGYEIRWEKDEVSVDGKLVVFNSNTKGLEERIHALEDKGWKVMTGPVFNSLFMDGLKLALSSEYTLLRELPIPMAGSTGEAIDKIQYFNGLLQHMPYVLYRHAHRYLLDWMRRFYEGFNEALETGVRITEGREAYGLLAQEHTFGFDQYEGAFDASVDLKSFTTDLIGCDLETVGFLHEGKPIAVVGLSHAANDDLNDPSNRMIARLLVARDPLEEHQIIAKAIQYIDGKTVLGFNSNKFDSHYFIERATAYLFIPPTFDPAGDLHTPWAAYAKKKGILKPEEELTDEQRQALRKDPNKKFYWTTLKALEEVVLHTYKIREDDLPGKDVPAAYDEYLNTGNPENLMKIIVHCGFDVVTLHPGYRFLEQKGLMKHLGDYVSPQR